MFYPTCVNTISKTHDYRQQKIKPIPIGINHTTLIQKKDNISAHAVNTFMRNTHGCLDINI